MIQELFQGSQPSLPLPSAASLYPLPPPSSTNNNPLSSSTPSSENPRCPRCDSSNTKFCYYNNYNLTQPRHFCKTCRRYWTKGGALRNVPIGGGCRKNKTTTSTISASLAKSRILKTITSSEIENAGFMPGLLNLEIAPNNDPIFWTSPQSSHLFSLMREKQNPNPKPSAYPVAVKGEGFLVGTHMSLGSIIANTTFNSTSSLGYITPSQMAPFDMATTNSYLRNNHQQNQGSGCGGVGGSGGGGCVVAGDFPGGGFQDMCLQRTRSSATNCYPEHNGPNILGNITSSTCMNSSTILDSAPLAGATDSRFLWGNSSSWCDTPTTNGALPQGSCRLV